MPTNANGWAGAPIKARDEAKTGRLGEERNAEWRPGAPVPFGLQRKEPLASLQVLAGYPTRLRACASRETLFARNALRRHSVNRP